MAKEITDIIEEIHEYFSEYNEFVSAEMGVMAEEIREAVYAINIGILELALKNAIL